MGAVEDVDSDRVCVVGVRGFRDHRGDEPHLLPPKPTAGCEVAEGRLSIRLADNRYGIALACAKIARVLIVESQLIDADAGGREGSTCWLGPSAAAACA